MFFFFFFCVDEEEEWRYSFVREVHCFEGTLESDLCLTGRIVSASGGIVGD
jgi:hypothetical protein